MAVRTQRYTYSNSNGAANTEYTLTSINLPVAAFSNSFKPLGMRVKCDISVSDTGSLAKIVSMEVIVVINYYSSAGVVVLATTPEPSTPLNFPITEGSKFFHLIFPDETDFNNFVKISFSASSITSGTFNLSVKLNTPNKICSITSDIYTWQQI